MTNAQTFNNPMSPEITTQHVQDASRDADRQSDFASKLPADAPKLLLHSCVLPADAGGGELVLHRHLVERHDFNVQLSSIADKPPVFRNKLWKRVSNTRFARTTSDIEFLFSNTLPDSQLIKLHAQFQPDLIAAVAHGRSWIQAMSLAQTTGTPLAVIFHDWWPDICNLGRVMKRRLEALFQKAHDSAALSISISEGMQRQLGPHRRSVVVPPIPTSTVPTTTHDTMPRTGSFRVCYAGNLFDYGQQLARLLNELATSDTIKLVVRGSNQSWPVDFEKRMRATGNYLPPAPREEFQNWLNGFDAHLCVMNFEQSRRRRMETSFPSKIVDSLIYGKPIIVWGPEYCSAVKWARRNKSAFVISDPCPAVAAKEINNLATNIPLRESLSNRAKQIANSDLAPEKTHQVLVDAVAAAIEDYRE